MSTKSAAPAPSNPDSPFHNLLLQFLLQTRGARTLGIDVAADLRSRDTKSLRSAVVSTFVECGFANSAEDAERMVDESPPAGSESTDPEDLAKRISAQFENANWEDPDTRRKLSRLAFFVGTLSRTFRRHAPFQGTLARRTSLVALNSALDMLIAELLVIYFKSFPKALGAGDKTVKLSELLGHANLEAAIDRARFEHVLSITTRPFKKQLETFSGNPLDVPLPFDAALTEQVLEMIERRNLFVHGDGVVNAKYLHITEATLAARFKARLGERIATGESYILDACRAVEVFGTLLLFACWRKWFPTESPLLHLTLSDCIYSHLIDEEYEQAVRMAVYAESCKIPDSNSRQVIHVNHALALQRLGRKQEATKVIHRAKWNHVPLEYTIALKLLEGRMDEARDLLPRAVKSGALLAEHVLNWPLFSELRACSDFRVLFAALFPDVSPTTEPSGDQDSSKAALTRQGEATSFPFSPAHAPAPQTAP